MIERKMNWKAPQEQTKIADHPDYARNLLDARTFIHNTKKSLLEGLSVTLTDKDCVLMIGFRPPIDAKMGKYAAPINLHQNRSVAQKETEWYFNYHYRLAEMFAPKQGLF